MADYNVLSQGVRPFNAGAAIATGQGLRMNNLMLQQQQQDQEAQQAAAARSEMFNTLLGDYLGQGTVNTLAGGAPQGDGMQYSLPGGGSMPAQAPPVNLNQLYQIDPQRALEVAQFQEAQQHAQRAQEVEAAKSAITKAQFVFNSKEPGHLVKTAFPEVWQQLEQMGSDPENMTPEQWKSEAQQMMAHYGPIAGVGPPGAGDPFSLSQGQKRFDAMGNEIAHVDAAPTDTDPNDKTFQRATSLRKEFDNSRGAFETVRSAYENVEGAERGDAGDTQLVLNFMRTISPGVRVQPGERIEDAASVPGVPQMAIGLWNKVVGGGKLNDSQRKEIRSQAKKTYETQERLADEARERYTQLAKDAGVDPDQVVGKRRSSSKPTPPAVTDFSKMTDEQLREIANGG